ncbi:MAG: phage integrase SAM-like domain-containing protein [Muribaculum sp.]|nr:phage integrase SAM-like domain-containing protein [Muribaculum sp.]
MAKSPTKFQVRRQDAKQEIATLFLRVQSRRHNFDLLFSSQLRVNVKEWQKAISSPEEWEKHKSEHQRLHEKLTRIELLIKGAIADVVFDKAQVEAEILAIADPKRAEGNRKAEIAKEEAIREAERMEQEKIESERREKEAARANVWNYLNSFVDDIRAHRRLNGGTPYTAGSVKAWNAFRTLYDGFDKRHKLTWDDIDRALVTKFMDHLLKGGYMVTSINKYLVSFRALVGYAYTDGIHNNDRAMMFFSKRKIDEKEKAVEIYLTSDELQALYEMKLSGLKEQVRDVFLVGCYTCQRVSDYTNLTPECFVKTARGVNVIRFAQQKTRNEVVIPILSNNLKAICEKYSYHIPHIVDQIINRYIKEILTQLSKDVPSLAKKVPTVLTMKQRAKMEHGEATYEKNAKGEYVITRAQSVTTHTARRSGITNMYLSHKFTMVQMMHVSGHKTQKTFMDYIKLSSEEIAEEIDAIVSASNGDIF